MKKTRHFLLFFAFALSPYVSTFANIVPLIKQGIAIGITPNPSYVRAADFDAGSFIDGATCTMPLIFSFDANGSELTKEFSGCTGIRMVDIYITNGCNPIEQAKVRTYIEVQNNLNLPNIPFCPDASVTAGVICLDDPAPISNPNAVIYPMPVMMNGVAHAAASKQGTSNVDWDKNLNSGSLANSGTITDKHLTISSAPPTSYNLPTTWKKSITLSACCDGMKFVVAWAKNSANNSNFTTTFIDQQFPEVNNPNQPVVYAYSGLATRSVNNQKMTIPAKVWDIGSYSPTSSPLSYTFIDDSPTMDIDKPNFEVVFVAVKDANGNKNAVQTYLDVQSETLIKGTFSLKSSNTIATYSLSQTGLKTDWYLDNTLVATDMETYSTPANLKIGKHRLKVIRKENGVCTDKAVLDVNVINSTATNDKENVELSIYPNPVLDYLSVRTNQNGDYHISINDITGKVLQEYPVTDVATQIDFSDYTPSVYFIKLMKNNEVIRVEKIVKGR